MSYVTLTYHIVIATYGRLHSIDPDYETELYRFIFTYLKNRDVYVRRIGGMPDHVHILCDIPPKYAISEVIKGLKAESSKYLLSNPHFPHWQKWSRRYGCFAVSADKREIVKNYIMNQRSHHITQSCREEFVSLLLKDGFSIEVPALGDKE